MNLGTLVIFSLPHGRGEDQPVQTFKFPNIRIGSFSAFTMRNLLWQVNTIPFETTDRLRGGGVPDQMDHLYTSLCDSVLEHPGYLLCNDEDDGFRLIWITDSTWHTTTEDACIRPLEKLPGMDRDPETSNVVYGIDEAKTMRLHVPRKELFNDRQTGEMIHDTEDAHGDLSVAFEAYLSIPNLLFDMVEGRPSLQYLFSDIDTMDDDGFPDYFYNLIGVNNGGRTVDIVAVVKNRDEEGCVGVYVTIDVFTQQFRENSWVENKNVADCESLRKLCNSLALNYRMRQRKLGPYSVDPDDKGYWGSVLCEEKLFYSGHEFDMERDLDPMQWKPFLASRKKARKRKSGSDTQEKPKTIPYSSLYPDCEMASNRNISAMVAAKFLTGRRSPLTIWYR